MSRKARMRAAAAALLALVAGGILAFGQFSGTFAIFSAETENPSNVAQGGWVNPAASLSASASGYGASFTWTAGTTGSSPFGALSSQQLEGANQGTTNSCSGASYGPIGSSIGGSATSTSDPGSSGVNGDYFCYQMRGYANSWYADAAFSPNPVQVGLVPTSISYSGSGSHQITNGTTITINFNQTITFSTANARVCIFTTAVLIGDSTAACTAVGNTPVFGSIAGTSNKSIACTGSSFGGSGSSTLTVTVGGCPTTGNPKAPATMSGTGTYTGTGSTLTSSTGGASQCTLSTCNPTLSY